MSLRQRLTFLYVLLLALALAAFGIAFYILANHRLYASLDDSLVVRSESIVANLNPSSSPLTPEDIDSVRGDLDRSAAAGGTFQVLNVDGSVLYSSFPQSGTKPPLPARPADRQAFFTRKVNGEQLRLLYEPIVSNGTVLGTLQVAASLRETDETLTEIRGLIVLGTLAAIILTSIAAYWVAGVVLRPVRQLSELAREIESTANFSRRLTASGPAGETRELVQTFNAMIDRVEHSLAVQRDFLADSSHELRRPLTVIRTNAEMLAGGALPDEQRVECLRAIQQESQTMSRLITDLLLLSRERSEAMTSSTVADCSALCRESVDRLLAMDHGRHAVTARISPGLYVIGDRDRLAQMLENLLENAARYTPDRGHIEVEAASVNGSVRLVVRDTGIGIAPSESPHIFDRFFRGANARKQTREGSGLGLAIVKHIAEAHGGRVQITSESPEGTTVTVDLPLVGIEETLSYS